MELTPSQRLSGRRGEKKLTLLVVLEEERPRARVNRRCHGLRLDGVVIILLPLEYDFLGHV